MTYLCMMTLYLYQFYIGFLYAKLKPLRLYFIYFKNNHNQSQ